MLFSFVFDNDAAYNDFSQNSVWYVSDMMEYGRGFAYFVREDWARFASGFQVAP